MKLKTSTKVSLFFSTFTITIIFIIVTLINGFYFYGWYTGEKSEVTTINEKIINDNFETNRDILLKKDLTKDFEYISLNIYKKDEIYYLVNFTNSKIGDFSILYNINPYLKNQFSLIKISIILLVIFSFLSYFISEILFTKLALKDIYKISNKLKNIKIGNIKRIRTTLRKDDDIYIITESINNFIDLISKYTTNLKQFNSNVAHEFKTPLMIISSEIEYATETGNYKDSYPKIEKQIDLLNELLETFIFISKVDEKKIQINKKDTNINIILKNIIEELKELYKEKNIIITENIKEEVTIKSNDKLILIAFKNLIDNSFKYTKSGGKIEIKLNKTYFEIKDNGIGITKEKLENIFDNFYREENNEKGYGIGLSIVKKIIGILGFKIEIESKKGKGSNFKIKF